MMTKPIDGLRSPPTVFCTTSTTKLRFTYIPETLV